MNFERRLEYKNGELLMYFPYNEEILREIQMIPYVYRRFVRTEKPFYWAISPSVIKTVVEIAKRWYFHISSDVPLDKVEKEIVEVSLSEDGKNFHISTNILTLIRREIQMIPEIETNMQTEDSVVELSCDVKYYKFINAIIKANKNSYNFKIDKEAKRILEDGIFNEKETSRIKNIDRYLSKKYKFRGTPFEHQIRSVKELLRMKNSGMFHPPGLGKTYISATVADIYMDLGTIDKLLVICPNSVKYGWLIEEIFVRFRDWYDKGWVSLYDASASKKVKERYKKGTIINSFNSFNYKKKKIIIINYESVRKCIKELMRFLGKNGMVILDEAHAIKNPTAKITRIVNGCKDFGKGLKHVAKRKMILTGTPIANKPIDAWGQLHFLGANVPASYKQFCRNYCIMGVFGPEGYKNLHILREVISECSIRYSKEECLDLPKKTYQCIYSTLEKEQRRLYEDLKEQLYIEILKEGRYEKLTAEIILTKILRLCQISSNPALLTDTYDFKKSCKFQELKRLLEDFIDENQKKVVIWTAFVKNLEILRNFYKDKYNPAYIVGEIEDKKMKPQERMDQILKFRNDPSCKLMICSKAGKEGINLTDGSVAIYLDRDFSLTTYLQSQDRIHRLGQEEDCLIIKLIGLDSIDQFIEEKLLEKEATAQYLQGDANEIIIKKKLSRAELERILG